MHTAYLACIAALILATGSAYAHTTVDVEQYSIEVGWAIEPPVVGYRNAIVFEITERGLSEGVSAGVRNAFAGLDAVVKFGGAERPLNIGAHPKAGHYYSDIIPTRTGTYSVFVSGMLEAVQVSVDVPVEDVESTAILDFPPRSTGTDSDTGSLKQALSSLQRDIAELRKGNTDTATSDPGIAYSYAVFGISLGAAGVIMGIVSMLKRKERDS